MLSRLIITDRCLYDIDDSLQGIDQIRIREGLVLRLAPLLCRHGGTVINLTCSTIEHMSFTHQLNRKLSLAFEEYGGRIDRFFFHHDAEQSTRLASCLEQIHHQASISRGDDGRGYILIDDRAETISTCGLDADEPLVCSVIVDPEEPEKLMQSLAQEGLPA